jgi:hypothetical protein
LDSRTRLPAFWTVHEILTGVADDMVKDKDKDKDTRVKIL